MARVLYITYDGILEPLGQSQVLNYLKALSLEHKIFLLSYEKKKDLTSFSYYNSVKKECEDLNIKWVHLNYHKSSFRTYFDIVKGVAVSFYICLKNRVDIVHSRSYLPALIALILNKSIKRKFIFPIVVLIFIFAIISFFSVFISSKKSSTGTGSIGFTVIAEQCISEIKLLHISFVVMDCFIS